MSTAGLRRSVVLKRRPNGEPTADDFEINQDSIPHPKAGEVVTRTLWLSIDPYMRGRLREEQTYAVAIQIGEVMTGETVGEVVASTNPNFVPGEVCRGAPRRENLFVRPGAPPDKIRK